MLMDVERNQASTRHDRKYFYKYVTAETALKILMTRTVKYSSPVTFNDPFDTQTRIGFDVEDLELSEMLGDKLYALTHAAKEPVLDIAAPLSGSIKRVWHKVKNSSQKMTMDDFAEYNKPVIQSSNRIIEAEARRVNDGWAQTVKASRVFCVSEEPGNLLMWAHYAKDHQGAVIEFECLPELDTPLCVAKKVQYVPRPPVLAIASDFIDWMTGQGSKQPDHGSLLFDLFLSKSEHWAYEREWRVFIPPSNILNPIVPKDQDGKEILFDLIPFNPREICSVYFGCKISADNMDKIKRCLTGDLEHVKKYDCVQSRQNYELDYKAC